MVHFLSLQKIRIDDNFSIPLIIGILLTVAGWLSK
jgi:dolichol kinase